MRTRRVLNAVSLIMWCNALLLLVLLCGLRVARAQVTTGDVLGTVHDVTGAVIPNAKVTLTLVDRAQTRTTVTDGSGNYTFSLLQSGSYSVLIEASGYATFKQQEFTLNAGDRRRIDASL